MQSVISSINYKEDEMGYIPSSDYGISAKAVGDILN
jgi:hypothetical protein